MWCEQCQSDVATEISADGQQLLCTTCHQPVRKVVAPSLHPETKSAREFLERWAREQQGVKASSASPGQAPLQPPAKTPAAAASSIPEPTKPEPEAVKPEIAKPEITATETESATEDLEAAPRKKYRLDTQHDAPAGPMPSRHDRPRRPHHLQKVAASAAALPPAAPIEPPAPQAEPAGPNYRLDDAEIIAQGPHFDVRNLQPQRTSYPGRTEAMWGQLLAYAGVGLLTVGTVFVLWGYFGELEQYASTGWLMSTAGQMLLLLGIVTLVGGGMQQTTHEVGQRIEHLGGRMIRIEQSTEKILKGPHFGRARRRSRKKAEGEQEAA